MNTGTAVAVVGVMAVAALAYVYMQRQKVPAASAAYVPAPKVAVAEPGGGAVGQVAAGVRSVIAAAPAAWNQVKGIFGGLFK
jgi:hypothetical protein